jgi:hypothetical protein
MRKSAVSPLRSIPTSRLLHRDGSGAPRLSRHPDHCLDLHGHSPYASGDYESHRSIYGGAYAFWWGEIVKPSEEEYILQLNVSRSDFLAAKTFPSYFYYNPYKVSKTVTLKLDGSKVDIYDLVEQRFTNETMIGSIPVEIPGNGSRMLVIVPSGAKRGVENGVLHGDGVPIDYRRTGK